MDRKLRLAPTKQMASLGLRLPKKQIWPTGPQIDPRPAWVVGKGRRVERKACVRPSRSGSDPGSCVKGQAGARVRRSGLTQGHYDIGRRLSQACGSRREETRKIPNVTAIRHKLYPTFENFGYASPRARGQIQAHTRARARASNSDSISRSIRFRSRAHGSIRSIQWIDQAGFGRSAPVGCGRAR